MPRFIPCKSERKDSSRRSVFLLPVSCFPKPPVDLFFPDAFTIQLDIMLNKKTKNNTHKKRGRKQNRQHYILNQCIGSIRSQSYLLLLLINLKGIFTPAIVCTAEEDKQHCPFTARGGILLTNCYFFLGVFLQEPLVCHEFTLNCPEST